MKRSGPLAHRNDDDTTSEMLSSSQRLLLLSPPPSVSSLSRENHNQPIRGVRDACKRQRNQLWLHHPHRSPAKFYGTWIAALLAVSCFSLYLSTSVSSTLGVSNNPESLSSSSFVLIGSLTSSSSHWAERYPRGVVASSSSMLSPLHAMRALEPQSQQRLLSQQQQQQQHQSKHPTIKRSTEMLHFRKAPSSQPAIAWLVSFPNSGTTYTVANAEHVTNHTTATNYAAECLSDVLQPLYPDLSVTRQYEDAPFLMSPNLTVPAKYVLTKTHCTGYSDDRPWTFDLHDAPSFEEFCRFGFVPPRDQVTGKLCYGNRPTPRRDPKFYTSMDNVHKLVHLIRSPFDNLVARMHLGVSERRKQPVELRDDRWLAVMDDTPDGLRNWCEYVDKQFHKLDSNLEDEALSRAVALRNATLSEGLLQRMKKVKCHSEIFRYTQFHNLVVEMAKDDTLLRLVSPPHVMYYEDYSTDLVSTTAKMVEYLEQPLHNPPHPFVSGKTYGHLWSKQEQELVAELIHDLATPETWKLLERYFPWWNDGPAAKSTTTEEDRAALAQYHESRTKSVPAAKMVWLMSYPTSGALFVLRNIVTDSNAQILGATHQWPESTSGILSRTQRPPQGVALTRPYQRVWPDHPEQSPYFFRSQSASTSTSSSAEVRDGPQLPPPVVALTKNICHAWACDACPIPENAAAFERSCRIVPSADPNVTAVPIDMNRVREVLVLVRNPFDVMRSRAARGLMQRAVEAEKAASADANAPRSSNVTSPSRKGRVLTRKRATELRDTRAGLVMWCADVDLRFQRSFASAVRSSLPLNEQPATWWDKARDSYFRWKEVVLCPSRWLASNSERYSQLKQTRAVAETQYVEFPVDRDLLGQFRGLPCYSDWLRMVQWYNHVMEFSRPRRTSPRQILRFEDYTRSEADARSKFDELAESLLGRPLETNVRELSFDPSRAKHVMLYTDEEVRLAVALVKTFGSWDVWDLFRPYLIGNETGRR